MDWLEIDEKLLNEIETEKVSTGYTPIESGAYIATINQAYLRKTDSGAVMFELETSIEDGRNLNWSTCVVSGDEKGNKSTYTNKKGQTLPLPGVSQLKRLFQSVGLSVESESPTAGSVNRLDKEIKAKIFKQLSNKKFTACARQYENEYNGEVNLKIDIENFLDADGKNSNGEYLVDKFKEKLEKAPIKLLKKFASSKVDTAAAVEAASSGW